MTSENSYKDIMDRVLAIGKRNSIEEGQAEKGANDPDAERKVTELFEDSVEWDKRLR